jgi:hypothetical protein
MRHDYRRVRGPEFATQFLKLSGFRFRSLSVRAHVPMYACRQFRGKVPTRASRPAAYVLHIARIGIACHRSTHASRLQARTRPRIRHSVPESRNRYRKAARIAPVLSGQRAASACLSVLCVGAGKLSAVSTSGAERLAFINARRPGRECECTCDAHTKRRGLLTRKSGGGYGHSGTAHPCGCVFPVSSGIGPGCSALAAAFAAYSLRAPRYHLPSAPRERMRTRPQLRVVDRVDGCVRASARARRDAAASPGIGQGTLVGLGAVRYRRVSV